MKKLLSLLTLLVAMVTSAWATTSVVFSSSNNNDAGTAFGTFSKNSSITAGSGLLKIFSNNNTNWSFSDNNKKGYRADRNTFVFYFSGETDLTVLYSQNNTNANYLILNPFSSVKSLADLATSDITSLGSAVAYTSVSPIPSEGAWATVPASVTVAADKLSWTAVKGGLEVTWEGLSAGYYQLSISNGAESYIYGFNADVAAATSYTVTWANGGHGTAPTSPTSASTFTLPTMAADGGFVNTGWTADQNVTVNKATVTAGTVIPVSTSVTLSANTTFTGVWKANSTFALTSDAEVEVTIDNTSTITSENAAGTVTYESADPAIATVSSDGVITAVAGGKTTITVTDPGSAEVDGGSATVTVLVPYANPAAYDSYVLNQDTYAFSNAANTKYYFTNGFTMTPSSAASFDNGGLAKSKKYSAARSYTIKTPSNVTVTYAVITARNNYTSSGDAANWGTVFGTNYSTEGNLPWSDEDPIEKDFAVASPSAGASLAFQPGGNQWQAIINLYTIEYHAKYTVSYDKGEGTGSMDGTTVRGASVFALPSSTFTAPAGKAFTGWLCSVDDVVYAAGANYTMTDANTTFTAQFGAPVGVIIRATPTATNAATVTGAIGGTADVNLQSDAGSWKFGGDTHHIGITLASGWTFKAGDIINVHITKVQDTGGEIIFYNYDQSVIYDTDEAGSLGDNKFVLTDAFEGKTAIYLYRINATNKWNAYIDYVEVSRPVSITIGATGWSTFSSKYALDFEHATKANDASADLAAYMVTGATGSAITKSAAVTNVPENTGLLLNGTASAVYYVPVLASSATSTTGNLMKACVTETTVNYNDNNSLNYVLVNNNGTPEFQKIVSGTYSSATIPAGKAYLALTSDPGARALTLFDDMTTGINAVNGEGLKVQGAEVYNLNGQRVLNPTKGLYIVNGKKVVVK